MTCTAPGRRDTAGGFASKSGGRGLWITSAPVGANLPACWHGEIVEVDPARLRAVADRVLAAAEHVAQLRWPTLDPDDLPDSVVGNIAAPALVAARLGEVVAAMRGWAVAAHMSVDAFERTDHGNGERFGRR